MSVDMYQRTVNSLDKDIADLEKKKAAADKKAANEAKKANNVTISKNASAATIRSKQREIERHKTASNKASAESADYAKKIADKRTKRNNAYQKLQKEQQKEQQMQQKILKNMQQEYEKRIAELQSQALPTDINMGNNALSEQTIEEYDAFISHAWEDKDDFVDELVVEMRKAGITVWYDTTKISWGDSMRQRIDEGLRRSKFGVVVLSPNYIAEGKYWTKAELNGLFQLESINGKMLLPIWYNLNKQDVINFSPIIADKKAMTTASMTAKEIAEELDALLQKSVEENI